MYNQEDLEALELFNEKADILKQSRFIKSINEQGIGVTFSTTTETRWPDDDARDAFILTFRFFIQNNEKSSFTNMAKVYEGLPISQENKELFKNAWKELNKYLDLPSPWGINKEYPTHRDILWAFIYGELSHTNRKWKQKLDQWKSNPLGEMIVYTEFISILANVMDFITYVQNLNEEVVKELSEKE